MCRYKLAVYILVMLSVFNFVPMLAAPVPVQEVRDASADVADGGEDVVIVLKKRAEEKQGPLSGLTQASPGPGSESNYLSTSSQQPRGSSTSDYSSGIYQETTSPIQLPSSASGEMQRPPYASGGTELPWYSSGEMRRPPYASGGTELPWYSSGEVRRPPYASGGTELPWYSSGGMREPPYSPGGTEMPYPPDRGRNQLVQPGTSVRTKTDKWVATTGIEPASSSLGQITPASSSRVLPPSGPPPLEQITPVSSSKVLPPSVPPPLGHITPLSSSNVLPPSVPPPSEQTTPGSSSRVLPVSEPTPSPPKQPKPQPKIFLSNMASKSKSLFNNLASKSMGFLRKLGRISKSLVSEMVSNPRLQIRISATASDTVNAARRALRGTVRTEAYVSTSFLSHKHSDSMVFLSVTLRMLPRPPRLVSSLVAVRARPYQL